MTFFRKFWFWLRRRNLESDFEEEARQHLELKIQEKIERGVPPADAERLARIEFGNPALAKEHTRQSFGFPSVESIWQDIRYAFRQLRKNPGFTLIAVLTLALGIGANSAIFSVVNAVLLRSLPYKDPDRLVYVGSDTKEAGDGIAYQHYQAWKSASRPFDGLAVFYRNSGWSRVTLTGEEPESVQGTYASANLLEVLGVSPVLGRGFTQEEETRQERVVVLSDALWKRRFAAAPDVLGKTLEVNGQNFQIIGVMPQTFQFPAKDVRFWAPITTNQYWADQPSRVNVHGSGADGFHWRWTAVGRLRTSTSSAWTQEELNTISSQWHGNPELELHATTVVPLQVEIAPNERLALYVLLGAVGFVLLIACSNVANLMLARGAVRLREMAIRTSLGASRSRLVRQLLTESLMLALIAGCLGLLLAHYGENALIRFGPADVPRLEQAELDVTVLAFTFTVSLLVGVLFGLAPAIRSSEAGPVQPLQCGGYGGTGNPRRSRISAALVVAEFALSVVLLSGAGLLIRSFIKLEKVDPGFRTDHVLTLHVRLLGKNPFATHNQLLERLSQVPGVKAVGTVDNLLAEHNPDLFGVRAIEGKAIETWGAWKAPLAWSTLSGDALTAIGVPLIKGRYFSSHDGPDDPPVVLIDESMARRYWPNQDPIGQHLKGWDPRGHCTPSGCKDEWVTVIGVVADMRRRGRERQPIPDIFQWYHQSLPDSPPPGDFVVRTIVDPEQLAPAVRYAIHQVDHTAVISDVATLQDKLEEQLDPRRFQTWLLALFAGIALLLAGVGIYGLMHFSVVQRTREMGIRTALGAQPADVLRLVIGRGMRLALFGLSIGIMAAFALLRVLQTFLFNVHPTDALTFFLAVAALGLTAITACYAPARRATKVDPIIALRHE